MVQAVLIALVFVKTHMYGRHKKTMVDTTNIKKFENHELNLGFENGKKEKNGICINFWV